MTPRFYLALPLHPGALLVLPEGPSRHAQVLRLQPADPVLLFNGEGGEWLAEVVHMGRKEVQVRVGMHRPCELTELRCQVTLAVGMPANERMDHLIEKATELGVATVQPLMCERSVLRLCGERAQRKQAHWQAVAVAACEQSGRTRVPHVAPVMSLRPWLLGLGQLQATERRVVLSTRESPALGATVPGVQRITALSGPEGGLSVAEEEAARAAGFTPASLGGRILRADTAPLAALTWWAMGELAGGLR